MNPRIKSGLDSLLRTVTDRQAGATVDGLRITVFPQTSNLPVVHIDRPNGEKLLCYDDVASVRQAFAELGYEEVEAWLPRQGVSWLSDGVSVGVSFRIRKRPAPAPVSAVPAVRFPKGTPEYEAYEAKLKVELEKWVAGEGEYAR
jgi:hypothetical protein